MTKTIDEQLERLASAQERSAAALESVLEAVTNFIGQKSYKLEQVRSIVAAGVSIQEEDDVETNNEAATEETAVEETAVEETEIEEAQKEEDAASEPEPKNAGDAEKPAEDEASSEDGNEGSQLNDDNAFKPYALPKKLTNDTLRGFARDLMGKEGKAAVFEVLADVGTGYKAVGEVSKDDLKEAHEKMVERLKG